MPCASIVIILGDIERFKIFGTFIMMRLYSLIPVQGSIDLPIFPIKDIVGDTQHFGCIFHGRGLIMNTLENANCVI